MSGDLVGCAGTVMVDLSPHQLLNVYANGMFPMADSHTGAIDFYSPEKRGIIELAKLRVSRSLRKVVASDRFTLCIDRDFPAVIDHCRTLHGHTWISPEIRNAYIQLHMLGFAHSVECYRADDLAGGLYGVAIHGAFFGESMFHRETDASKVALVGLVRHMESRDMELLDTQYLTPHLASLGGEEIDREEYLGRLQRALASDASFFDSSPRVTVSRRDPAGGENDNA